MRDSFLRSMQAPVLETERLRLRGHLESDLSDCYAMWSDPVVVQYIGGRAFSCEDVWARILRYAGHWQLKGFGFWLIEERESGQFAGEIGFADFKREIVPPLHGTPEMGWVLTRRAQGKGYATEAAEKILAWAVSNMEAERMICLIHPDNLASIRVASKFGFKEYQSTEYKGAPTVLFERIHPVAAA